MQKYKVALDSELNQRLVGNAREVESVFQEVFKSLSDRHNRLVKENILLFSIATGDVSTIRSFSQNWIFSNGLHQLKFYNREGRLLYGLLKESQDIAREMIPVEADPLYLKDKEISELKAGNKELYAFDLSNSKVLQVRYLGKISNKSGKVIGYEEQLLKIDEARFKSLFAKMNLEVVLFTSAGSPLLSTHSELYQNHRGFFNEIKSSDSAKIIEREIGDIPFGFTPSWVRQNGEELILAVGASKVNSKKLLDNVNLAFMTVTGVIIVLLVFTIWFVSQTILKPLQDLLRALYEMQETERSVEIPVNSRTEVGLLAISFNQMNRKVHQVQSELRNKIKELEKANLEISEAQTRLIHSSKMVSLGQLVAGVAHELNNPIGFIYSNMTHLRDYSNRLLQFADWVEKSPSTIAKAKENLEIEYIKEDLPKLVASCEDGARRTRDIVIGLRNFSRLEEAQRKLMDVHENIDSTLNLLSGEIKNRIQVVKDYGSIPMVDCFANQMNQVFMNILSNAVQAIDGVGNIWITTKLNEKNISKKMVVISIQDSGKGMSPEIMQKIFDPFFSTKGIGQGTGLGLSISYGIVQSHGGDIIVKSQPNIGTEFIVSIPVEFQSHPLV